MKRLAIIVHGLFTSHTTSSPLDKLTDMLSKLGFEVYHYRYGFTNIAKALENVTVAKGLSGVLTSSIPRFDKILVVGHSNGCAITHLALKGVAKHASIDTLFLSPSVRSTAEIPKSISSLDVFYNPYDVVLRLIKPLSIFGDFLHRCNWGRMGVVGYLGSDTRVTNHRLSLRSLNLMSHHNPVLCDSKNLDYLSNLLTARYSQIK